MITDLFSGNFFLLYLIFVISVITVDKLNEKQKIAIIYICSYGMTFDNENSKILLLILVMLMIFLVLEYFTTDKMKLVIIKKFHYKVMDFVYMGIFQYKIWAVLGSIIFRIDLVRDWCQKTFQILPAYLDILSVVLLVVAIHWMFNITEVFRSFTEIYDNIWKYPYYRVQFDKELDERLNIIVEFEDRLYWKRKSSYSAVSFEFIKSWFGDKYKGMKTSNGVKIAMPKRMLQILKNPKVLVKGIINIVQKIRKLIKHSFNYIWRGHSTIPMQLIRILSYKHGLIFKSSKVSFKYYKIFKRKIYEVFYSRMFFVGLKNYLKTELCSGIDEYQKYIVYLYPHIVQTKIDGKTYAPAMKAFINQTPMNKWEMDKVIKMAFGFNGKPITSKRLQEKKEIVKKYGL